MHIRHGFVLQEHTRRTGTASNMCRARSNYKPFHGPHRSFSVVLGKGRFIFVSSHAGERSEVPGGRRSSINKRPVEWESGSSRRARKEKMEVKEMTGRGTMVF